MGCQDHRQEVRVRHGASGTEGRWQVASARDGGGFKLVLTQTCTWLTLQRGTPGGAPFPPAGRTCPAWKPSGSLVLQLSPPPLQSGLGATPAAAGEGTGGLPRAGCGGEHGQQQGPATHWLARAEPAQGLGVLDGAGVGRSPSAVGCLPEASAAPARTGPRWRTRPSREVSGRAVTLCGASLTVGGGLE